MNRKDDHIQGALTQSHTTNDFDRVRFVHDALSAVNVQDVDLKSGMAGKTFPLPFYINAMTGGSDKARELNAKLSKLAAHFDIPMALGSISAAIRDKRWEDSFTVVRDHNPKGFVMANLGAEVSPEKAKKAVELICADALQIHLNNVQEIVMPEGDRDFSMHESNISALCRTLDVPIIVKEVGFGLSGETIKKLLTLGVGVIDVAGRGGTNFSKIENARRKRRLDYFDDFGLSTVESLLETSASAEMEILASGGVRDAMDILKAIRLGASMVGMSGFFLKLVHEHPLETAVERVEDLIDELKGIMAVLGAKSLAALKDKPVVLDGRLLDYIEQRSLKHPSGRP